jgi:hypothetical protein
VANADKPANKAPTTQYRAELSKREKYTEAAKPPKREKMA